MKDEFFELPGNRTDTDRGAIPKPLLEQLRCLASRVFERLFSDSETQELFRLLAALPSNVLKSPTTSEQYAVPLEAVEHFRRALHGAAMTSFDHWLTARQGQEFCQFLIAVAITVHCNSLDRNLAVTC